MFSAATKSAHPSGSVNWIDDVFNTTVFAGSNSSQTITTGIDLENEGGLVWLKGRNYSPASHWLQTSEIGWNYSLQTNTTGAALDGYEMVTSVTSTGYTTGTYIPWQDGRNVVSWTFRKQAKFFDVVTYTGTAYGEQVIPHNLGSAPGMIIVKRTDTTSNWFVYHRSLGATKYMYLNTTGDAYTSSTIWYDTEPTSTNFTVGYDLSSGGTYVAYLFAHDAGGFGAAGTDNVISCGSYEGASAGVAEITLGYEPQWIMVKRTDAASAWTMVDNMRGLTTSSDRRLQAQGSNAEDDLTTGYITPTATGFKVTSSNSQTNSGTLIYIAIRRPMKPPTSGTEVFKPIYSNNSVDSTQTVGFAADWFFGKAASILDDNYVNTRLIQLASDSSTPFNMLITNGTTSGQSTQPIVYNVWNTTSKVGNYLSGINGIYYYFRRASGFFDTVCYTGTGSATTQNHNLGVAPELMIVKKRSFDNTTNWYVYAASQGATSVGILSGTNTFFTSSSYWNDTSPTSSVFSLGSGSNVNQSGTLFVSYLFATVAGVSKVGSYTGTGTTKQVDCGFTGGARFVLIKRTDSTGDWYVWDSARGIVSGNDPYFLMNDGAAQVTNTDYVDAYSAGFEISSTAPAAINANGGSFIFLAIA